MRTRYRKIIRDLKLEYGKNMLLVLAIAIGIFAIGTILGGYGVIKREMASNYLGTNPASATIELEDSITETLLDSLKQLNGIKYAERHATIVARMKVGDKWYPLLLFVIDDFKSKSTNKINYLSGNVVPATGTMLVERTAIGVMKSKEGGELIIKTPNGIPKKVLLSGVVHDPGLAPAWQEQTGYGYITLSTLQWLGETQGFDQLRIRLEDKFNSEENILAKAQQVASQLQQKKYQIHEIQIPPPGKHPHQSQMNAVMTIFVVFSFCILILGSILVATSMSTLMVKQVRQIGVMKTIGATSGQIARLYLGMTLLLCVVALLISLPLSRIAASGFCNQIAFLLNLEIYDSSIPYWVIAVQILSGIVFPLIVVAFPVIRSSRISVRKALDNYDVSIQNISKGIQNIKWPDFMGETVRLSARNVFRRSSRLIMILCLLEQVVPCS